MRAMVLAAGRGERLRPLTDEVPKPLLEIAGRPIIAWTLASLRCAGIREVVVNNAWLGEQIVDYLGDGSRFDLRIFHSNENPGELETAGGICAALDMLSDTFILINGDIFIDYPLDKLFHHSLAGHAHIILVDNPSHHRAGDFALGSVASQDTARRKLSNEGATRLTYSGLGLFNRDMFSALPPGRRALGPLLRSSIEDQLITGEHHRGCWFDIGTVERLHEADRYLRQRESI